MAVINRPIGNENDCPKLEGKCAFCDQPSAAYWMGRELKPLEICRICALDKLPLLIADAVSTSPKKIDFDESHRALDRLTKQYWRGLALQLMRDKTPASADV